jgi:hypothetical protein
MKRALSRVQDPHSCRKWRVHASRGVSVAVRSRYHRRLEPPQGPEAPNVSVAAPLFHARPSYAAQHYPRTRKPCSGEDHLLAELPGRRSEDPGSGQMSMSLFPEIAGAILGAPRHERGYQPRGSSRASRPRRATQSRPKAAGQGADPPMTGRQLSRSRYCFTKSQPTSAM